jgi:hypothetical protein
MTARAKDPLNYSFDDLKIPEASSFKYSGIITCTYLSWADPVTQHKKPGRHFML